MFKSLFSLAKDVVEIAVAPVEIAANLTREVTKPIAEELKEIVKDTEHED